MSSTPVAAAPTSQPSIRPALLFMLASAWIVVAMAGGRLAGTLTSAALSDAARLLATALLLFAGFYGLAWVGVPDLRPLSSVGLVRRPGAAEEFGRGAALGWAIGIALLLPALLTGALTITFAFTAQAVGQALLSTAVLVLFGFALQLVLAGLPVRLLVRTLGPSWTGTAVALVCALLSLHTAAGQGTGILVTMLASALVVTAFLRTRALWLPLGLQLGWTFSLKVLFGSSSVFAPPAEGVVRSVAAGPVWLTGGLFGPELSATAIPVLLIALLALFRITWTYAWHYTYQPPVPGGYPMDVPPPAEHLRQEQLHAAPLVQIGGAVAPHPAPTPGSPRT